MFSIIDYLTRNQTCFQLNMFLAQKSELGVQNYTNLEQIPRTIDCGLIYTNMKISPQGRWRLIQILILASKRKVARSYVNFGQQELNMLHDQSAHPSTKGHSKGGGYKHKSQKFQPLSKSAGNF